MTDLTMQQKLEKALLAGERVQALVHAAKAYNSAKKAEEVHSMKLQGDLTHLQQWQGSAEERTAAHRALLRYAEEIEDGD